MVANIARFCEPRVIAVANNMRRVLKICDHYAGCEEPVLVTGETGTGKELVCRRLHARSRRNRRPFVAINCAAIPADLFERELFGHMRGAYTGAVSHGSGLVEHAAGGTLFLDEIGELPLAAQPKLLRLLDDQEFYRVGDPQSRRADVRIVAATNADLSAMVDRGRFRSDLMYRLIGLEIFIPPLRKRRKDIIPILRHFLVQIVGRKIDIADYLNQHEIECVCRNPWPGNARELLALARKLAMRPVLASIEPEIGNLLAVRDGRGNSLVRPTHADLLGMLSDHNGNKARLAQSLGVARSTLYRWLQQSRLAEDKDASVAERTRAEFAGSR